MYYINLANWPENLFKSESLREITQVFYLLYSVPCTDNDSSVELNNAYREKSLTGALMRQRHLLIALNAC